MCCKTLYAKSKDCFCWSGSEHRSTANWPLFVRASVLAPFLSRTLAELTGSSMNPGSATGLHYILPSHEGSHMQRRPASLEPSPSQCRFLLGHVRISPRPLLADLRSHQCPSPGLPYKQLEKKKRDVTDPLLVASCVMTFDIAGTCGDCS